MLLNGGPPNYSPNGGVRPSRGFQPLVLYVGGGVTDHYGDLLVPPSFKAVVEIKHRKNFNLLYILTQKPGDANILGWWKQACDDAERSNKELGGQRVPILIAKGNRTTPVICLDWHTTAVISGLKPQLSHMHVVTPYVRSFCVYELDAFLKAVDRGTMEQAIDYGLKVPHGTTANRDVQDNHSLGPDGCSPSLRPS